MQNVSFIISRIPFHGQPIKCKSKFQEDEEEEDEIKIYWKAESIRDKRLVRLNGRKAF